MIGDIIAALIAILKGLFWMDKAPTVEVKEQANVAKADDSELLADLSGVRPVLGPADENGIRDSSPRASGQSGEEREGADAT